jgi:hypothetical protein
MSTLLSHLGQPAILRRDATLAAAAMVGVTVVHVLDGPASLEEAPHYVGALELALTAAAMLAALALIVNPTRDVWLAAAALAGGALVLYLASRTVGLPGAGDDRGNWTETLGLVSVAVEAVVIALAAKALRRHG